MKSLAIVTLALAPIILPIATAQISDACASKLSVLNNSTTATSEAASILQERQSRAVVFSTTSAHKFVKNFTSLEGSRAYDNISERCAQWNFTACHVSTSVAYQKADYQKAEDHVVRSYEESFPMCVPPQCRPDDGGKLVTTEILRPVASFCEKEGKDLDECSVVSEDISCPQDGGTDPLASVTRCGFAARLLRRNSFKRANEILVRVVNQRCLKNLEGDFGPPNERRDRCQLVSEDTGEDLTSFALHKNYSALINDGDAVSSVRALTKSCEVLNHAMCYMDTQITNDGKIIYETQKPVCVPSSCTKDAFVATLDDPCLDCDIRRTITCPNYNIRDPYLTAFNRNDVDNSCASDVASFYEMNSASETLDRSVVDAVNDRCIQALHGASSGVCSFKTPTTITRRLAVGNETLEADFADACHATGAKLCLVDAIATTHTVTPPTMTTEISATNNVVEYVSFPLCKPVGCSESAGFVANALLEETKFLEVRSISCFDAPSASPTISTVPSSSPTMSFSVTPSTTPTVTKSVSPSATPTVEVSLSPTLSSSLVPTLPPSINLSELPSLKASPAPSALSSTTPSVSNSAAPTTTPSSAPTVSSTMETTREKVEPNQLKIAETSSTSMNTVVHKFQSLLLLLCGAWVVM